MEWDLTVRETLAFSELEVRAAFAGEDILLLVAGGERPHLGSVVYAVPRLSLTGDGTKSVTSSVMNLTGHKDEFLCRGLAEAVCREFGCTTVCTGGFHVDGITKEQLHEVTKAEKVLEERLVRGLGELITQRE